MALEDFLEPEVAVTAVVAAAVFSPRARKFIRRGAVYGLAGILVAGDALTSVGKNIGRGVQAASQTASNTVQNAQTATANAAANPPQATTFTKDTTNIADTQKRTSTKNATKAPHEDVGGQA